MKIAQTAILLALGTSFVFADSLVPTKLSYQGRVSDSSGTLIGATQAVNRTVYYKLYTVSTGGTPIWAESQTVTISAGEFSVLIGNGTGISGFAGPSAPANTPYKTLADIVNSASTSSLYLGVTVDDGNSTTVDIEVSPRQQFVSGAFALRATVAESVASSGITASMIASGVVGTDALGTLAVTTAKVAASAITAEKIGDSAVTVGKLAISSVTAAKIDTTTVGLWTPYGTTGVYRLSGNVGIGTATPSIPLSFASSLGDKIALSGSTGNHSGFGIQSNLLQIHTAGVGEDVAFGWGSSASFNEKVRIKGSGLVGIGTSTPGFPLNFASALGDKISLYGVSGNHYGFGVQSGLLQIHSDSNGSDVAFGYGASAGFVETMRIKGQGNVGINTSAPAGLLHINSNVNKSLNPIIISNDIASWGSVHLFNNFKYITTTSATTESFKSFMVGAGGMAVGYEPPPYGSSHAMYVGGWVGIMNNAPYAPLHVSGGNAVSFNLQAYLDGGGVANTNETRSNLTHSIIADNRIRAAAFDVASDSRIKTQQQLSDGVSDLAALRSIQITDYRHIDVLSKGGRAQKKVIAQQVEQVYPQAVGKGREVVPDIYKQASLKAGWVNLATNLKQGERVRLITEKTDKLHEVLEVGVGRFRVSMEGDSEKLFVYGREVDDFRFVDYDAISMLNVSATQELHRQLEAERGETAALRRKLSELESSLGARLEALEKASKGTK